jgi:phosphoribosylformimino-5-aminoimidazole carboxamide ribotide isomerase
MKNFKPSILTLSLIGAGLSFATVPGFAQAQDAQQAITAEKEETKKDEIEVIEVKGFRGSIIKSLNTKRYSDTVVDAISADDIGGLPDVSIADSLTRLPGVTSIRIDGQSSELNIRGLSGNYVFSTLNGREQVSSAGGRSVQFDQFPSELIQQAQVYKSQKASLIEGGVAGTIELQTANALQNEEDSSFRFSAHGNWNEAAADNEDSDSFGRRITSSYQTKLLDDTFGVALGVAHLFQPTVSSRFVNYKFEEEDLSGVYDGAPESLFVSNGFELNERGGEDTRNAFVLALNWEPRDDLRFQFDAFSSDFDSEKFDRGLRVSGLNNIARSQLNGSSNELLLSNARISNGALVGGTFSRDPNSAVAAPPYKDSQRSLNVQTQADNNTTNSSVRSWGLKGEWDIQEDMMLTVDLAHSEGEETYKDQVLRMAYFEDSSAETPVIDDNLVMDYQLNGLGIPSVSFNQDFTDTDHMMVTSAESYPHFESNTSDALRVDFEYQLDNEYFSSIDAGFRVSKREYKLERARFLYGTSDDKMRNGQYISYEGQDADGNPIEVQRFAPYQLNAGNSTATTIGGDLSGLPGFLTINNNAILNAWLPNVDRTPIDDWRHSWTLSNDNKVEEDVTAAYVQVNIDAEVFGIPVMGNIGIRAVETEQKSTGLVNVGAGNGDVITDGRGVTNDAWINDTRGVKYRDYLPSLNLNFSLTDEDQLRFAYAKVMARPELPTLANSGNFSLNERDGVNYLDFDSSTSPELRPFYAEQIDISFEHYFSETDGAFVFALWNKEVESKVEKITIENFDFAAAGFDFGTILGDNGAPIQFENGNLSVATNNADAGYIRGVEIAYTQTFSFLPGLWSGLGANLNFSYTESEIKLDSEVPGLEGTQGPFPGLSPRVYSATVFYDWEETFTARVSARHRAAYVSDQLAIGNSEQAYFDDETIVSAQMSYRFSENLQGVVSVDNLTDEPNRSYFGDTSKTGTIQYFGRTIYFGVNYSL